MSSGPCILVIVIVTGHRTGLLLQLAGPACSVSCILSLRARHSGARPRAASGPTCRPTNPPRSRRQRQTPWCRPETRSPPSSLTTASVMTKRRCSPCLTCCAPASAPCALCAYSLPSPWKEMSHATTATRAGSRRAPLAATLAALSAVGKQPLPAPAPAPAPAHACPHAC
jgi:hypothetical protein